MYTIRSLISYAVCAALLVLSGCASYKSSPLRRLNTVDAKASVKKGKVLFAHKIYNKNDSELYLGRDVIKAGYQPVQLTITNKTPQNLLFSSSNVSLPCANVDEVKNLVYTSTLGRAFGYGITGACLSVSGGTSLVFGVSCVGDWLCSSVAPWLLVPGAGLLAGGLVLISAAITDSIWSHQANKQLDADYDAKALQALTIKPGKTLNGLIFVPLCDFRQNFSVTLLDVESSEKLVLYASPENAA